LPCAWSLAGTAPAGIVLGEPDLILAIGAAVVEELYGKRIPVVVLTPDELAGIPDRAEVSITQAGEVTVG
jgi:predicted aconitase with swiveling domain